MLNIPIKKERNPVDLSRRKEKTYLALPPLAKNKEGEIINMSTNYKLVENGEVDIQEKIQSYHDEVDLYHILKRVASVDDAIDLYSKNKSYADISGMPSDFHSLVNSGSTSSATFDSLSDNEKQAVLKYFGLVSESKEETKTDTKQEVKTDNSTNGGENK